MLSEVIVWTKFCVPCVNREGWEIFEEYCKKRGVVVTVVRTTYLTQLHEQATALWGGEDYTIFIQKNRECLDFNYAIKCIKNGEEIFEEPIPEKVVKIRKKPVRGGKKK